MKKISAQLNWYERIQSRIWHWLYPIFPLLQRPFSRFHDKERQKYHLGWLARGKTLQQLERHLHRTWGFGNHFVAWHDTGQVLSWRKLVDFEHQYHIRVFSDGDIRGHYEYTPEAKPLGHFEEVNEQRRLSDFKKFLGEFLASTPHVAHLKPDINTAPESELTFDSLEKNSH
jgi:hypothetical protein